MVNMDYERTGGNNVLNMVYDYNGVKRSFALQRGQDGWWAFQDSVEGAVVDYVSQVNFQVQPGWQEDLQGKITAESYENLLEIWGLMSRLTER